MKFKKVIALTAVVASMAVMSQSAFADRIYRCHNHTLDCNRPEYTSSGSSTKFEYYERGTGAYAGHSKNFPRGY